MSSTTNSVVTVGEGAGKVTFSNAARLSLIAGACEMESRDHAFMVAGTLKELCTKLGIGLVYKTSFDKANRSSLSSKRGVGLEKGLEVFADLKKELGIPVLTDIHTEEQCAEVGKVVDILQIPAFLSRQTDLLVAAAKTGRVINVKKGQFLAPWDMKNVLGKLNQSGNPNILLCERGASFGYNTLVSDMRSLPIMAATGAPLFSTPRIQSSSPAGRGKPPAESGSSWRRWRVLPWPSALPGSLSKPIRIRITRPATGRTWSISRTCRGFSRSFSPSTRSPRPPERQAASGCRAGRAPFLQCEAGEHAPEMGRLVAEFLAGGVRLLGHRGILLCHLIHTVDGSVDLDERDRLFRRRAHDRFDQRRHLQHLAVDIAECLAGAADKCHARGDLPRRRLDEKLDLLGEIGGAAGELADFLSDDGKAFPCVSGACCLDARVERQKIGLKGDLIDGVDNIADPDR